MRCAYRARRFEGCTLLLQQLEEVTVQSIESTTLPQPEADGVVCPLNIRHLLWYALQNT
eukprot:Skav226188  [mRNA]  locus=scaffold2212:93403:100989:+ [translate_table: standard]